MQISRQQAKHKAHHPNQDFNLIEVIYPDGFEAKMTRRGFHHLLRDNIKAYSVVRYIPEGDLTKILFEGPTHNKEASATYLIVNDKLFTDNVRVYNKE